GRRLDAFPKCRASLPRQFDDATNRTIELIDVLWLKGNAIVAAFEIESTTSIYSGLLRMADLVAMQPNLSIPLYLVAPEERREKVVWEINRPTFARFLCRKSVDLSPSQTYPQRWLRSAAMCDIFGLNFSMNYLKAVWCKKLDTESFSLSLSTAQDTKRF